MTTTRAASVGPGDYTDPAVRGLQLRVRGKGPKDAKGQHAQHSRTWLMRFKWKGQPVRLVLGHFPSLPHADAAAKVLELRRLLDEGIDPRRARPTRREPGARAGGAPHTIETLADEFLKRHVRPRRKRPEYAERMLKNSALKHWAGRDARTIKPREVIELLDRIVDAGSPVMANRVAALLAQMFKFGVHRSIVEASPVQLLYRPGGKEKPRQRVLTDAELKALLTHAPSPRWDRLHRAINLLLLTGQRRGELALARWSEIDFDKALWQIPAERTKTGVATAVPLSPWAVDEFKALKREAEKSPFVFPLETDRRKVADPKLLTRNLARAFEQRFPEIGIKDAFTLHDLRRTCRTGLAKLKIPPHIAERVLNHAQEKIPGTYDVHDYLDEKREALEKWALHLRGLARES